MTLRIAVLGRGRMGQEIRKCIAVSENFSLSGIWARNNENVPTPIEQSCNLAVVLSSAQVAIDFTLPEATEEVLRAATEARIPLVCGVSGLPAPLLRNMSIAAEEMPILYDRNMSLGIAVLQQLVKLAGAALCNQFVAEIHETHHVHKIDAPSGTALMLGEALAASRSLTFADVYQYDPTGIRTPSQEKIHFEVIRRGENPGEHTVLLKSPDESLSLTHKVDNRRVFALGALQAARWLVSQAPGLYSMQNLVARSK